MRPTQKQLALKLKQVEKFEKDWGECTRSRAIKNIEKGYTHLTSQLLI